MTRALRRLVAGVRWYLREIGGDARFEEHRRECAVHGHPAPSRREYERRRADAKAGAVGARCC